MATHRTILDQLWPSDTALSNTLKERGVEVAVSTVGMWRFRDDIPSPHWPALIALAADEGKTLTLEELASSQKRLRERRATA